MTKKQWLQRAASVVLLFTLLIAVMMSAQAATTAHMPPTAISQASGDSGLTTIFGMSARSLQLLR
ncbi:MAG: hypothetical protein HZC41_22280 [Chloroflexi bacterium]|nr:hypothetical protein [Chloroflexota bacterium]